MKILPDSKFNFYGNNPYKPYMMGSFNVIAGVSTAPPPPTQTWEEVITSYTPRQRFALTEASGDPVNTGSVSGLVIVDGTPAYRASSLVNSVGGLGVENGDGWRFNTGTGVSSTVIQLIKTPATLTTTEFFNSDELTILRGISDGALRIEDWANFAPNTASAAGTLKPDEWNLIFWQLALDGGGGTSAIFTASQTSNGVVSSVASGSAIGVCLDGTTTVRGTTGAVTTIIGEIAVVDGVLTLGQMQALSDTLTWAASASATWSDAMTGYDPLVWYRLSEGSSPAQNAGSLGAGGNGTYTGAGWVYSQNGLTAIGNAVNSLSGGGSASRIATTGYDSTGGAFTALALFRALGGAIAIFNIIQDNESGFTLGVDSSGRITANVTASSVTAYSVSSTIVSDANWNLIAVTLSGGVLSIYHTKTGIVNHVTENRTGSYSSSVSFGTTQEWGRRMNTSGTRYDELAMFDTALTFGQIQALADALTW